MQISDIIAKWSEKAREILSQPHKGFTVIEQSVRKFKKASFPSLEELKSDFFTTSEMIKAYLRKEYRDVPWASIVAAMVGLIYFLNPFDLIPDFIPFKGYLDDTLVLTYIFSTIHEDLKKFREWRQSQGRIQE